MNDGTIRQRVSCGSHQKSSENDNCGGCDDDESPACQELLVSVELS